MHRPFAPSEGCPSAGVLSPSIVVDNAYVEKSQGVPNVHPRGRILDTSPRTGNFTTMAERSVQLVLHYDGTRFAGWQRQPNERTVQGELEQTLTRLCNV